MAESRDAYARAVSLGEVVVMSARWGWCRREKRMNDHNDKESHCGVMRR